MHLSTRRSRTPSSATPWSLLLLASTVAANACGPEVGSDPNSLGTAKRAAQLPKAQQVPITPTPPPSTSIDPCLITPVPLVDRLRTKPAVDPATCMNLTPLVGLVRVGNLPADLRAIVTSAASTRASGSIVPGGEAFRDLLKTLHVPVVRDDLQAVPSPEPLEDEDWLLYYVPPADDDGRRRVTLSGDPDCDPDPCPGQVDCGRPTQEKCPLPDPDTCSSAIAVPGSSNIPLSRRSLQMRLSDNAPIEAREYRGVLIAANEIIVSGHVRSNGTDLILMAQRIMGLGDDATVNVTPLRPAHADGPRTGSNLVLLADQIDAPGGLTLRSDGAPGALATTLYEAGGGVHGVHPDCVREGITVHGTPECFPCDSKAGLCNAADYSVHIQRDKWRCVTHGVNGFTGDGAGTFTYVADYPPAPATLPPSFDTVAPGGGDGGVAGRIVFRFRRSTGLLQTIRHGGVGAMGLHGFRLIDRSRHSCPLGMLGCSVDQHGSRWTIPDGTTGITPGGSSQTVPAVDPRARINPALHIRADDLARMIGESVGELIIAEEQLFRGEKAYRGGQLAEARAHYDSALRLLGDPADYECVSNRYKSLRAEASGRVAQLDAGLDLQGRAADWAPHSAPAELQTLVLSELQHATNVAIDIKLNALLSMVSAQHQAAIAQGLNEADGELAALEATKNAFTLREKQTKAEELSVYVQLAEQKVPVMHQALIDHWQTLFEPPPGLLESILKLFSGVMDFIGAVKDVVTGLAFTSYGEVFQLVGSIGKAAKTGYGVYQAFDELAGKLQATPTCANDATCKSLMLQLQQAQAELFAANRALQAAGYAVQAELANSELFEARRRASRDVVKVLQNNGYEVHSFERLARAGQVLCRYGQLLVDDAAADLYAFKRAAALWDVPDPAADSGAYGASGNNYDYDFNQLLDVDCQANGCTLWGEYNQFLSERLNHLVPNATTVYLGTQSDGLGPQLASLLHHTTVVDIEDADGNVTHTRRRAEIALGVLAMPVGDRIGARPSNLAIAQGAPEGPPMINATDVSSLGALQVHSIAVSGTTTQNQPLRVDFPWRVSRPSVERYANRLNPPATLEAAVMIPAGRSLDAGSLVDELVYQPGTGRFAHQTCCNLGSNPVARPEALRKPWTLWVPVCGPGQSAGQTCATVQELQHIATLQITLDLRYKVLTN